MLLLAMVASTSQVFVTISWVLQELLLNRAVLQVMLFGSSMSMTMSVPSSVVVPAVMSTDSWQVGGVKDFKHDQIEQKSDATY